ncbi:MAG: threonine--tRNA ligase [bacterium]|nr:threonine--tRNA ligase [bacterium]
MSYPIETIRHSTAHLMAAAVLELFPGTKFGIGPTIENGFYYDFDLPASPSGGPRPLTPLDLLKIEKRMKEIIKRKEPFVRQEMTLDETIKLFSEQKQNYKVELLKDLKEHGTTVIKDEEKQELGEKPNVASLYRTGKFTDLCRGPHVATAAELGVFKLKSIAGAYWRGSEKNKMLTRIYGLAFFTQEELDAHLKMLEEAEKRDHRKLGADLDLFVFSDLVGKGLPLLTPKGTIIRKELEKFVYEEETKRGYQHVITPDLAKVQLYETSGHYPYYKDTMYPVMKVDEDELILRPMTCPHHFMLYKSRPRSYRELPLRLAEFASQFRYEKSGELTGLMRARMFCLADAHIIAAPEQAADEIKRVLDLIDYANSIFGLKKGVDYRYRLSLGNRNEDKKYYKDDAAWDKAEDVLRTVLKDMNAPYFEVAGEAAFYGPKIDVQIKKVNGHEETAFTVQYDFVMPKRFDLKYIDKDGQEKQPLVIHRSSIGCFERTMAFLIERFAGAFPVWLSPVQVAIIPVGEKHLKPAQKLTKVLEAEGVRVQTSDANETVGYKIRQAEKQKVPYMLVVGDKEAKLAKLNVRFRGQAKTKEMTLKKFIEMVKKQIEQKK